MPRIIAFYPSVTLPLPPLQSHEHTHLHCITIEGATSMRDVI